MKVTTPKLIRWAGLSAMVAGIIFTAIHRPIHLSIPAHSSSSPPSRPPYQSLVCSVLRGSMPDKWKKPVGRVWLAIFC
jgi:hypothetical protein